MKLTVSVVALPDVTTFTCRPPHRIAAACTPSTGAAAFPDRSLAVTVTDRVVAAARSMPNRLRAPIYK